MDFSAELKKVSEGKDLSIGEIRAFLDSVFRGEVSKSQVAGMLMALKTKGESPEELAGFINEMRLHMTVVRAHGAIDVVGTGGDGSGTFNISTAAAFVAAGAGAKVAKHGNKAMSSACGSANVLEALGVQIALSPRQAEGVFEAAGIVFLMAPLFHPALKAVTEVRTELRVRTTFNLLGPFANPARAARQLVGVPNSEIAKRLASAATLLSHPFTHLLIVASDDGLDEISLFSKTKAYEVKGKKVRSFRIDPRKLGLKGGSKAGIMGGTAADNARIIRELLLGKKGAARDIVVLNTAYALLAAGIAKSPKEGIALAQRSIDTGAAKAALDRLVAESRKFST